MARENNGNDLQFFNHWAASYERSPIQRVFDRVHDAALDLTEAAGTGMTNGSILDVGCGTGRLLRKAGMRWPSARLIGVDPADEMVEIARGLTPSAAFHVGVAENLPLPDASVDAALSTLSFHHWEGRLAGLREVARVLRPGACFCFADAVLPGVLAMIIRHFGRQKPAALFRLFGSAGLRVEARKWILAHFVLVTVCRKD
jgi:ubiquinone/menaquinone biosynthesis C-methylase UbiE